MSLKPGQRTPAFRYEGVRGEHGGMPVASWYLKLAGGPRLAPNWGYVRVEIPWGQFENRGSDFGLIDRLSDRGKLLFAVHVPAARRDRLHRAPG